MRVTGLLNYGLEVPSLEVGADFYTDFGLSVSERADSLVVRCDGRNQDQTVLLEGPTKRLHHVAFSVEPGTLPRWQHHLEQQDIMLIDRPSRVPDEGLWFRDPDANVVHLQEKPPAPWRPYEHELFNFGDSGTRTDDARWEDASTGPRPRRLGHLLVFVRDLVDMEDFYRRALGLRVSDRIPGKVTFMNCGAGDHHVFGFIRSTHPGLHHTSFEVANIDQIGMGARQMAAKGHVDGWGLGRHTLGSNLFHYVRDPWGSWVEYFTDMDRITEGWTAKDWDIPPAVWSPLMPADFLINGEARFD